MNRRKFFAGWTATMVVPLSAAAPKEEKTNDGVRYIRVRCGHQGSYWMPVYATLPDDGRQKHE